MATSFNPFNCGAINLGGWHRQPKNLSPDYLNECEKEIKELVLSGEMDWHKIIIATVLKEQEPIRKLLRKYGFKKTPEAASKYRKENTQCIYYWDSNCIKKDKAK